MATDLRPETGTEIDARPADAVATEPKEGGNLAKALAFRPGASGPLIESLALTHQLSTVLQEIREQQAEQDELLANIRHSLRALRRQK